MANLFYGNVSTAISKMATFTNTWIPRNLIIEELSGIYGNKILQEMGEIITYYDAYEHGAEFHVIAGKNYEPPELRYCKIKTLIDKEARFLFSRYPDFRLTPVNGVADNEKLDPYRQLIEAVFDDNSFKADLAKAAKDCFIGKRIAIICSFNEVGIQVNFIPSLEFVYELDEYGKLSKIVTFYSLDNDSNNKDEQRLYRKKYWMENGACWFEEGIYDGSGNLVEEIVGASKTKFEHIPAVVILNGGLTGDTEGESDVAQLMGYESMYSELSNYDIDSGLHSMNPIRYTVDMSPDSTKDLSLASGAYWDLNSDQTQLNGGKGIVGMMESSMNYSDALTSTLDRIEELMYTQLEIPNITMDTLRGVASSGKTLKGIYWGLIVRCDEKMNAWKPALQSIVQFVIEGAKLYPESRVKYIDTELVDVDYEVEVENQYPLPEDEAEEKSVDLLEIQADVMSRKSYLKKWRNLTDEEADEEIAQIAKEKQLMEEASFMPEQRSGFAEGE